MIYLKACKKCNGDMVLCNDIYGAYLSCIQCGRILEVQIKQKTEKKELKQYKSEYELNKRKCINGHFFIRNNTYYIKDSFGNNIAKDCRLCNIERGIN